MISCSAGAISGQSARGGTGSSQTRSRTLTNACRAAERQLACGHLVDDRTQRKQVAALVGANPQQLFGRHVFGGAGGTVELFLKQIGKLFVARKAEVDEYCFAARTKQHIGRLQVEMQDMLLMQIAQGIGDRYRALITSSSVRRCWSIRCKSVGPGTYSITM